MRHVRVSLRENVSRMRDLILKTFPDGTTVTDPAGGSLLWVSLPGKADTLSLYREAMKKKILIAPGALFSTRDRYGNCFRINAGLFDASAAEAVSVLAKLSRTI